MKIKSKLTLGIGLLFLLILVQSIVGILYVNRLKNDTKNILTANYNTLEYSRNMLQTLDFIPQSGDARKRFAVNLQKQENNITEVGEKTATRTLKKKFHQLIRGQNRTKTDLKIQIRQQISKIMQLNMTAIQRKSTTANQSASNATVWIILTGTTFFIIAYTMLINFPENIAHPIKVLTEGIREISAQNYTQRLHFGGNSEFREVALSFNKMAKKLEEYNNSSLSNLLKENKRIETLINNLTDPIIGMDENYRILYANEEAKLILNVDETAITSFSAIDIAKENQLMRSIVDGITEFSSQTDRPIVQIFSHGKACFFEKETIPINIVRTGEEKTEHIGHFIVFKDVTSFKENDFAKTNFIATVSHELKTPIAAIKMSLNLLENDQIGPLNGEQQQLIQSMYDDSNRLLKITSELLEISKIESGHLHILIEPCAVEKILQNAHSTVKTTAFVKQLTIVVENNTLDNLVLADSDKSAWVLSNLLVNAIKYSPEKSTITLRTCVHNENILFEVIDQGTGIAEEYQHKIFNRYFQIPGVSQQGTGLGLSICKEMIEAQNGSIYVKSALGQGANFSFTLPISK